jgi:hypothetical protein
MSVELFLERNGKMYGPYTPEQLKQMAQDGDIEREAIIRKGIDGKPYRASSVKGLFPSRDVITQDLPQPQESQPESKRNIVNARPSTTWNGMASAESRVGKPAANIIVAGATEISRRKPMEQAQSTDISKESKMPRNIAPVESETDVTACPFCGETIKKIAKKCKHCNEILDVMLRAQSQPLNSPHAAAQHAIHITNVNTATTAISGTRHKQWSGGVAAVLSILIPGLGQVYKGQLLNGFVWFVVVIIGYACFIVPGLILHLCCIVGAASGDPYR